MDRSIRCLQIFCPMRSSHIEVEMGVREREREWGGEWNGMEKD